jgi:hypothetical protein
MISSKKVIREDYFDGNAGSSNIEEEKKWWSISKGLRPNFIKVEK